MTEAVSAFDWLARRIKTPRDENMELIRAICERHGLSVKFVMSKSRLRDAFLCRREIILALRAKTGRNGKPMSWPKIGSIMGMDHTSAMNCAGQLPHKANRRKGSY